MNGHPIITVELSETVDRQNIGLVAAAIGSALDRTVGRGRYAVEVTVPKNRGAVPSVNAAGGARFRG